MGWPLAGYRLASHALPLVAPALLRRRLARGKEDPARWREKLGEATLPRPEGRLVWLHAVGLGEVLALRGLIGALAAAAPDLSFLVTSSARSSAQALAGQLPPRTVHQFLPLDAPHYLARFLGHWRPALSVWAEQDLWPGAVAAADAAGVPLALVNARMNAAAYARRARARGLYADLLSRFRLVAAQEDQTASHLAALGARDVRVTGSLKAAAPPLAADLAALAAAQRMVQGRRPWLLASSHPEDEAVALAAQAQLHAEDPAHLLILAPRDPARGGQIATILPVARRAGPMGGAAVWVVDTVGEMGLWYRLCPVTLIGGTFGPIEGHNPWEPAALGSAILHGPRVANFAADFGVLDGAGAALPVTPGTLAAALRADHRAMAARAIALSQAAQGSLVPLAHDLLELMA
ncbi:3-deoxy-D-manno-octulosonic acid transferase [Neotabrizicola sp. VNH66]|uniref:3-deoxy-D-manno-octulosonic acid transferase n=1 Tax=Neotabrizicola sp. VNH66 TaxID=3400918 RepID=UPI003C017AF7